MLQAIENSFTLSASDMRRIAKDFRSEMEKGLVGKKSSLKMIPAYVTRPTGDEKGKYFALDLGGTNFRVIELTLRGGGRTTAPRVMRFTLKKSDITGSGEKLFDLLAASLKKFLKRYGMSLKEPLKLGFTFSFPVRQAGPSSGRLVRWTKGFRAAGVVGKDIVMLLNGALDRQSLPNIKVAAMINDTVGTLAAASYSDPDCDVGVIIGTGTNACYTEKLSNIAKWKGGGRQEMIINTEWGNFNKLRQNVYDRRLEKLFDNPGEQRLEKMVSGMYLGELSRLVLSELAGRGEIFGGKHLKAFGKKGAFGTEAMSAIAGDYSKGLGKTGLRLKELGIPDSSSFDRRIVRGICRLIAGRAAGICASCLAAIIAKIDPELSKAHTIAIDGSVYEKFPGFAKNLNGALRNILPRRSLRLKTVLVKDGSGKGAAIIAAADGFI